MFEWRKRSWRGVGEGLRDDDEGWDGEVYTTEDCNSWGVIDVVGYDDEVYVEESVGEEGRVQKVGGSFVIGSEGLR